MENLSDFLSKSVNEASVPAPIRKLGRKATPVSSRDFGDGWLIDGWMYPYSEDEYFTQVVELCLKSFGGIVIAGKEWKKPIDMDGAMRELERNGEEPEGPIGFVFIEGGNYPE